MLEPKHQTDVVSVMGRIGAAGAAIILAVLAIGPAPMARAEQAQPMIRLAQAAPLDARPRRVYRPQTRLRVTPNNEGYDTIYPHYNPGPNAVRVCNAHYEQEYRPSGTVIVPKMHCVWTNDPRARAVAD
jgi:hypothetical protein